MVFFVKVIQFYRNYRT